MANLNQVEFLFHACGHRKPHRIWGPHRRKQEQRAFYRARRCGDCEEARDKARYGQLQPVEHPAQ